MGSLRLTVLAWCGGVAACSWAAAQEPAEWLGAEAAIRQWAQPAEPEKEAEGDKPADPLAAELEAFAKAWPKMIATEAAGAWLGFYDRWVEQYGSAASAGQGQPGGFGGGYDSFGTMQNDAGGGVPFTDVIAAMPGPAVWPALLERTKARAGDAAERSADERALRLMVFYLGGDTEAFQAEAEAAVKVAEQIDSYHGVNLLQAIAPLTDLEAEGGGLDALRARIAQARADPDSVWRFEVPDVVTLYGDEEAEALLIDILGLSVESLDFEIGRETRALAVRLATERVDVLPMPRWELVSSVDAESVALYEALQRKFAVARPAKSEGGLLEKLQGVITGNSRGGYGDDYESWEMRNARVVYLLGLIVLERTDDATTLVEKHYTAGDGSEVHLPYGLIETLQASGAMQPLFEFVERMVDRPDGDAFWSLYIRLGAQTEQSDRVLAKVEDALSRVEGPQRIALLGHLVDARLAADEVDAGVAALIEQIETLEAKPEENAVDVLQYYAQIAQIGLLMDQTDWLSRGLDGALAGLSKPGDPQGRDRWERRSAMQTVVEVLIETDRLAEAERLLVDAVEQAIRSSEHEARMYGGGSNDEAVDPLLDLVTFYGRSGRLDDVLTLLTKAPHWGVTDFVELYTQTPDIEGPPLAWSAAQALAQDGRRDEALRILDAALRVMPGDDALYDMLVALEPADIVARLDALYELDPYEERPLIWKASLQLEAGDVAAAEATIRQAIAVDPSDGEQGPGDRMRAYSVLADILREQGDIETAEVMEGAVRAIRLAEDADRFDRAGLLSRAVSMYKEALTHFADAYCIQSRLAIQLANLGRYDEAAEHYERAFELMPDSFGRVESHCFGCEGAFSGERAKTIAERVFDRLVVAHPFKPQVHYLRGYLNSSRDRDREALADYREAVRMDPQYLNAWKKIHSLSRQMHIDRAQRDEATLKIFRLDPLGRHSSADLNGVKDIAEAWRAVESAQPLRREPPTSLLALTASAERLDEQGASDDDPYGFYRQHQMMMYGHRQSDTVPTPGAFLAQHPLSKLAGQVLALNAGQ